MADDSWQTHHLVWLLDDDLDELGCVSAMAGWDDSPSSWAVMARPEAATAHHWWEYDEIGRSSTEESAIQLLQEHVVATGGERHG